MPRGRNSNRGNKGVAGRKKLKYTRLRPGIPEPDGPGEQEVPNFDRNVPDSKAGGIKGLGGIKGRSPFLDGDELDKGGPHPLPYQPSRPKKVGTKTPSAVIGIRGSEGGIVKNTPKRSKVPKGGTKNNYCKGGVVSRGQGKAKRGIRATKLR